MNDVPAADSQSEPLVYACSGASNLGQLSNEIAIRLDQAGLAEMSCAEAVGIEAGPPYASALSGRSVIAVSGCPLACASRLLAEHGVAVTSSIQLENRGVMKAKHVLVEAGESERIYDEVVSELDPVLAPTPAVQAN
ncbi:MAG TPA: putative zinc-binding protein [Gaiellaceae bacterium]